MDRREISDIDLICGTPLLLCEANGPPLPPPAAPTRLRIEDLDDDRLGLRCEVCHWPLSDSPENGCVRGNCSQRPRPTMFADKTATFNKLRDQRGKDV